jgi:hypothetical protein
VQDHSCRTRATRDWTVLRNDLLCPYIPQGAGPTPIRLSCNTAVPTGLLHSSVMFCLTCVCACARVSRLSQKRQDTIITASQIFTIQIRRQMSIHMESFHRDIKRDFKHTCGSPLQGFLTQITATATKRCTTLRMVNARCCVT